MSKIQFELTSKNLTMKKIILSIVPFTFAFLIVNNAFGQDLNKLYTEYAGNEKVNMVNLQSGLISLAANFLKEEDKDLKEVIRSIDNIRLMITEDKSIGKDISDEANKIMNKMDYEELIRMNDEGEKIRVLANQDGNKVQELIVMVAEEGESILLQLNGNIDLDKVSAALKALDIDVNIDDILIDIEK